MQTRVLRLLVGLCVAALGACSAPSSPAITSLPGMNTGGSSNSSGGSGNPSGGSTTVAGTSGMAAGSGGMSTTAGAGGSSGAGTAGSGAQAGAAGTGSTTMSAGCGKPLPALVTPSATTWSEMADQDARAGKPPPMMVPCEVDPAGKAAPPCVNGMKPRGFFVLVKPGFDNTKPSKVIYEAAGLRRQQRRARRHLRLQVSGFRFGLVPAGDPGRHGLLAQRQLLRQRQSQVERLSVLPDAAQVTIEDNFCVDPSHQYFSGYSTGAWVAQQFTCAFPDVLRGIVASTGNEPPQQPACVAGHPVAGLFLHDLQDTYNTYAGMLPGCARLLTHNGCTTTTC